MRYAGEPTKPCTCHPRAIQRYSRRISGPILDRVQLHMAFFCFLPLLVAASIAASRCRFYCRFAGQNYSCYPVVGLK
ncbi:MAG: ATP-binding protein [Syntrophobacteraceae bacterium]